jgi:hypothetical protein
MVDGTVSRVQDALGAPESPASPIPQRPNHLDLVDLYARRIELIPPKKAAHASWPQKADQPQLDAWASIELVQFGRPMPEAIPGVAGDASEPIEFMMPPQLGKMSLTCRGRDFLVRHSRNLNALRLATVQRSQRIERSGSRWRRPHRLS